MRELTTQELAQVSGGEGPLGSSSASEYFTSCMDYTNPSATFGLGTATLGLIPRLSPWVGGAMSAWTFGTAAVCAIGTIPYTQ